MRAVVAGRPYRRLRPSSGPSRRRASRRRRPGRRRARRPLRAVRRSGAHAQSNPLGGGPQSASGAPTSRLCLAAPLLPLHPPALGRDRRAGRAARAPDLQRVASRAASRSRASSRLRSWERVSCAAAVTRGPSRAWMRAFWRLRERRRRGDVEHGLHPRRGDVRVLTTRTGARLVRSSISVHRDGRDRAGSVVRSPSGSHHASNPRNFSPRGRLESPRAGSVRSGTESRWKPQPSTPGRAWPRAGHGSLLLRLRSDEQLLALFRAGNDEAFRRPARPLPPAAVRLRAPDALARARGRTPRTSCRTCSSAPTARCAPMRAR